MPANVMCDDGIHSLGSCHLLLHLGLEQTNKCPLRHTSFYLVLLNFIQVVSTSGDEPDWAGDWSPGRKTGVSYLNWEGWQVQRRAVM